MRRSFDGLSVEQIRTLARRISEKRGVQSVRLQRHPDTLNYPVSFAQERFWLVQELLPGRSSYNAPFVTRLRIPFNVEVLQSALGEVARRHEVLRTTFLFDGEQIRQAVAPAGPVAVEVLDLQHLPASERLAQAMTHIRSEVERTFDLEKGPLWRVGVVSIGNADVLLYAIVHHAICDAASREIIVRELLVLLPPLLAGQKIPALPEPPVQYGDFALFQREMLQANKFRTLQEYWHKALHRCEVLNFPTDARRPAIGRLRSGSCGFRVPESVTARLRHLGQQEKASLFMTVLAGFVSILHRYAAQDDIVVGTAASTRTRPELEGLVGCFINTVALRTNLAGDPSFRETIGRVRRVCIEAFSHADLPFERIVRELRNTRDIARNPLFEILFQLEEGSRMGESPPNLAAAGDYLDGYQTLGVPLTNLDIEFHLYSEKGQGAVTADEYVRGVVTYDAGLFNPDTIERLAAHYGHFLEQASLQPDLPSSAIAMVTATELEELRQRTVTEDHLEPPSCLERLSHWARVQPGAIAIVDEDVEVSYAELDQRSASLAERLRTLGVSTDTLVGVACESGTATLVGMLGILKAGGAFVPLGGADCPDTTRSLLVANGVTHLVHEERSASALARGLNPVMLSPGATRSTPAAAQAAGAAHPERLAYGLLTAESIRAPVQAPAIVLNTHRGLGNTLAWMQRNIPMADGQRLLHAAGVSSGESLATVLCALGAGATLVWAREAGAVDAYQLLERVRSRDIHTIVVSPFVLRQFVAAARGTQLRDLRRVVCTGEELPTRPLLENVKEELGVTVCHIHGCPEAAGVVASRTCSRPEEPADGTSMGNVRVHVLDGAGAEAPVGVTGEIVVAGASLGRGYRSRAALTAEKFVPDPNADRPGGRMFRTGDRGRRLPGGGIELLGRKDDEFALVHGERVAVQEIESVMAEHPGVLHAAVRVCNDPQAGEHLVAYVQPMLAARELDAGEILDFLASRMPLSRVPVRCVLVNEMPLLAGSKIDRERLAAPPPQERAFASCAAGDAVETAILDIWRGAMGVDRVGVHDDFFALGGHSMLAVQLIARVRKALGVQLSAAEFYREPTVSGLARRLGGQMRRPC